MRMSRPWQPNSVAAAGVLVAEPNYVWGIPEQESQLAASRPEAPTSITRRDSNGNLRSHFRLPSSKPCAPLKMEGLPRHIPMIPSLFINWGWQWIGADIVWPNTTASAGVCELDTGVDYTHPDLSAKIIKGKDFVNADLDPKDDNGHGTHVAGIIAASMNNAKGIAGVSNGKVVAVKVLNAQGWGSLLRHCRGN